MFFVLPYLCQSWGMFNCSLLHANLNTNIPVGNYFPNQSCLAAIGDCRISKGSLDRVSLHWIFSARVGAAIPFEKKDSDGFRFPTQSSYSWPNLGLEWSICFESRVVWSAWWEWSIYPLNQSSIFFQGTEFMVFNNSWIWESVKYFKLGFQG